ncbi:MAG: methyltransferase domain-containing protein [Magnetospirillum sp. WYHS-4]
MLEQVKVYYGKVLQGTKDLKTDACCTPTALPAHLRPVMADIHPEVQARYYGCGLVMPPSLEGASILDLGCGAGRDCYALARLVGPNGRVVGVDMTEEQLEVARRHVDWHRERFGYAAANVDFRFGYIEKLDELGMPPASFDVIVSNCVINLSPDKAAVLKGAWSMLKEGGELYFSDVYADRRVPEAVTRDPVLHGECLGGALYWNDFLALARQAGFADARLVEHRPLAITEAEVLEKTGPLRFFSATYRLFKLAGLEAACEDYGQAVVYKGSLPDHPHRFVLDTHHCIETGRIFPVCGNTWRMLHDTRFRPHFEFFGDFSTHYGIFPGCGTAMPFDAQPAPTSGGCC